MAMGMVMAMVVAGGEDDDSRELRTKVETLATMRHKNIVKLYSSYSGTDSNLLVYEYMPNNNLWNALHGGSDGVWGSFGFPACTRQYKENHAGSITQATPPCVGSVPHKLPDECDWVVWIDPPPTELVGQAFEELHGGLERSWIKASRMEKKVMDLNKENKKMQLKLQKRNDSWKQWVFSLFLASSLWLV
ncbi:Leucine Rich Repeat family protein [Hordeum vulgare]|nr:Leucine Rich Repeat family protein [Hordeum vulgare]